MQRYDISGAYPTREHEYSGNNQIKNGLSSSMITIRFNRFVEPAGVEPASKRGSNTLSTCLSSPSFFEYRQDRSHQPLPYPLNLIERTRLRSTIPDLAAPPDQRASRPRHLGDVSSRHYGRDKARIYYTSIKQQERSYFRQLQF